MQSYVLPNISPLMKIALVSSHGGHLTELQMLSEAFERKTHFYITYDTERTRQLDASTYLIDNINTSPVRMIKAYLRIGQILHSERPDVIISTGSEIAIPAFSLGGLFGAHTIFIESWCHVKTRSATGRIVYPMADIFLVQWPGLASVYGDKARYEGAVV